MARVCLVQFLMTDQEIGSSTGARAAWHPYTDTDGVRFSKRPTNTFTWLVGFGWWTRFADFVLSLFTFHASISQLSNGWSVARLID